MKDQIEQMIAAAIAGKQVLCACTNRSRAYYQRNETEKRLPDRAEWNNGLWDMHHQSGGRILFVDANNQVAKQGLEIDLEVTV